MVFQITDPQKNVIYRIPSGDEDCRKPDNHMVKVYRLCLNLSCYSGISYVH